MKRERIFWLAVAVSLIVSLTPWAGILLYPFKLFTTWVHECGHAVAALLVGGHVMSISIQPNTSGLTQSLVPSARLARGFVASAGYLSAAIVGCLLMAATRVPPRRAHAILLGIGICMLVTVVLWIRNPFGAFAVVACGLGLVWLARRGMADAVRFLLSLLAIQVALNAVYDIRVLFLIGRGRSDAATMEELFLLPSWVWATTWMVTSVAMLCATLWVTDGRRIVRRS